MPHQQFFGCGINWPFHTDFINGKFSESLKQEKTNKGALCCCCFFSTNYGDIILISVFCRRMTAINTITILTESLQWRHNGRDSVWNHQPHDCFPNRLFRHRSKKTSKLRVTGLSEGNSPGTGDFPAQMASNAENISIWWRHHHHMWSSTSLISNKWIIDQWHAYPFLMWTCANM